MDRLPSERVRLAVEGPSVEVERLRAWPIYWTARRGLSAFYDAERPEDEYAALNALYAFFVAEAQPAWSIADHRGPIAPTASGMLRFEVPWAVGVVQAWLETHLQSEAPSAADAVLPDGELRDAVKTALRQKRTPTRAE